MNSKIYSLRSIVTRCGDIYSIRNKKSLPKSLREINKKDKEINFVYYSTKNHLKGFSLDKKEFNELGKLLKLVKINEPISNLIEKL